jgi:hypothetical protein
MKGFQMKSNPSRNDLGKIPSNAAAERSRLGRAVYWSARGFLVIVALVVVGAWVQNNKVDKLAAEIAAEYGAGRSDRTAEIFAETDREIERLRQKGDEARALVELSTGMLTTVADWRAGSEIKQVLTAEMWLKSAVSGQAEGISDATFRLSATEIATCVNSSIRDVAGIDNVRAVEVGALCIAKIFKGG